ncbi:MAG: hypothetical protein NZ455_08920 [Bacteroidia bacterium]|nr:hypothetical protein [Bacteroidia bacterium]MDW8347350.1 hypothetical protein [Bacteroidia bacterium]
MIAQKVPSQPHLEYVKILSPVWKPIKQNTFDTLPIYTSGTDKLNLLHAFTLDSLEKNLSLFFLGILGKCEIYFNKALIYKGQDKYGKLLVSLPHSHLRKVNVIHIVLYTKEHDYLIGLIRDVYVVRAAPERNVLSRPKYSNYEDTVAFLYPYSYLYGFKGNRTLLKNQLQELKQNHIHKVKFMFPPPSYAYTLCDSLDIFIVDNSDNSLKGFYYNSPPEQLKKKFLEYVSWYSETYTKTKAFSRIYISSIYLPSKLAYSIKTNLWFISCILVGYLVLLKMAFYDIIDSFNDWFRRYRLVMEIVKNKRLISSIWVNALNLFQWMIIASVLLYSTVNQFFLMRNSHVHFFIFSYLFDRGIFLLWLVFVLVVTSINLFFSFLTSGIGRMYNKGKIVQKISEISLINHFPILYWVVGILFILPLSPYFLEHVLWTLLYITLTFWLIIRLARMYRFGEKGLKLHSITIILYLCGAEILPYFLLIFYIFNFQQL